MMNRKIFYLMTATLLAGTGSSMPSDAANRSQLLLQMNHGLQAGAVSDGSRLGKGILIGQDVHTGFRLWSEQAAISGQPDRYVLAGQCNQSHQIRVRLLPRQLVLTERPDMKGAVINTINDRVVFDILADGNQQIKADSYTITLNGATLLP